MYVEHAFPPSCSLHLHRIAALDTSKLAALIRLMQRICTTRNCKPKEKQKKLLEFIGHFESTNGWLKARHTNSSNSHLIPNTIICVSNHLRIQRLMCDAKRFVIFVIGVCVHKVGDAVLRNFAVFPNNGSYFPAKHFFNSNNSFSTIHLADEVVMMWPGNK